MHRDFANFTWPLSLSIVSQESTQKNDTVVTSVCVCVCELIEFSLHDIINVQHVRCHPRRGNCSCYKHNRNCSCELICKNEG